MSIAPLASMEPAVAAVAAVSDLLPAGWDNDWSIVQEDVSDMSARELRVLASRLFRALDEDFPPYGAQESYAVVVEELDQREARARQQQPEPGAAGMPKGKHSVTTR